MSSSSTTSSSLVERNLAECRWINRGRKRTNLTLLMRFITIWTSLLVASVNCEVKLSTRADKNSVEWGIKGNQSSREPRFISFDSSAGKIDIDLDLSIPFLSIPLQDENNKSKHAIGGFPMPLVKLNTKALAVFGTLMAIITFVIPILFKQVPEQPSNFNLPNFFNHHPGYAKEHKRSDRGLDTSSSYFGDSINEILGINSNLAPCVERLVCSAVATATQADEPTNLDKIIDVLASHRLFEEAVNGTVIKEAAAKGREASSAEDCAMIYNECIFNQKILLNILKMIGL